MASSENNNSSLQNNWADLPIDLLTDILDKVSLLQDYIRFGGVCKSWYFVTQEQKQKRRRHRQFKEPPLLHIPVADNPNQRALYSVSEGKIYNYRFSVPYRKLWCGASHGWLAIPYEDSITKDLYITLFNPFSGGTIQLPPLRNNLEIYQRIREYEPDFKILNEFQIHKVILSCDPFLYPDDYIVAVIYDVKHKLSWLKSGQRKWNLGVSNVFNRGIPTFSDILFHGGSLYGINYNRHNCLYFTDELSDNEEDEEEKEENEYFTSSEMWIKVNDFYDNYCFKPYLVESSNENMLLIRRIYYYEDFNRSADRLNTIDFKIYKLKLDESDPDNGRGEWIEIKNLEKDDVLFLGPNNSVCIPAPSVPNCKPNSIYYTDEYTTHSDYTELRPHEAKDMGVFHLEDRSWEPHFVLHPSISFMSPAAWISPTLN